MQEPFFGALEGHRPRIAGNAIVAPGAVVVGRVRIGARSSAWYGRVHREVEPLSPRDVFAG